MEIGLWQTMLSQIIGSQELLMTLILTSINANQTVAGVDHQIII